tara:strand:- start:318 stop:1232 length:915 start_codon:yes stop_codon:yes gene_type:complete
MNKDTRLITLSSEDAVKLNGSYGSNVFFNIPDIVVDNEYISHLEVALIDAQIPVSWYLINNETNTLNYIYNGSPFSIQLTNGNYNANTLITEMTNRFDDNGLSVIITLSQITGLLLFKFQNAITPIEFVYLGSIGLFRILGFNAGSNVSGVSIVPPNPLNLLGIQKLNIASQNLATISSFSSRRLLGNQIIQTIPVNVPSWNLITYENKNNIHGKMKSRNLNNIDIQVIDEFGRFVEFNNIDWNITLQVIIFRTHEISFKELNLPTTNLKLPKEPKEKEPKEKEPKEKEPKNKDLEQLKLLSRK